MPLLLQVRIDWGAFADLMGDAALFLIVGGLFMLGLVVLLVVLRSFFPAGQPARGLQQDRVEYRIASTPSLNNGSAQAASQGVLPDEALDEGRRLARKVRARSLDEIVEGARSNGLGEARFLRVLDERSLVRFYECNECREGGTGGCARAAGYMMAAVGRLYDMETRVLEPHCRGRGDPACEFEVRYAPA